MATTKLQIHPDYLEQKAQWVISRDLFEGKRSVLLDLDYLWPHAAEVVSGDADSNKLRAYRERRTRYLNLHKIIVSLWKSLFFREDPTPDDQLKAFLDEHGGWDDIDGAGTAVPAFLKNKVLPSLLLYGRVYTLADTGESLGRNRKEQKESGFRPFLELLQPLSVVDWSFETKRAKDIGKYTFLRYNYSLIPQRDRADEEIKVQQMSDALELAEGKYTIRRFQLEDNKGQTNIQKGQGNSYDDADYKLIEEISTTIDRVPIARIIAEPWLDSLGEESLRFYNMRSNHDNIQYNQQYQKGFLFGISPDQLPKAVGEYIWNSFENENGSVQVIDPVDTSGYDRSMSASLDAAFKVGLLLTRQLPADSKAVQGAETIQEEKDSTLSAVQSTIDDIETLINESFANYALFAGKENFEGKVSLNKDVSKEDFEEVLAIAQAFSDKIRKVGSFEKALLKKAAQRIRFEEDDLETILDDIEEADFGGAAGGGFGGFNFFGQAEGQQQEQQPEEQQQQAEGNAEQ